LKKRDKDSDDLIIGWTVYLVRCADGSYYGNLCKNMNRELANIKLQKGIYFSRHPERLPVEIVFKEERLPFKEAYAKSKYLKEMNKKMRERMLRKKMWPIGGSWKKYLLSQEVTDN